MEHQVDFQVSKTALYDYKARRLQLGSPQSSVADTKHQADTPEKKLYQADKDAAIDGFPSVTPGLNKSDSGSEERDTDQEKTDPQTAK